MVQSEKPHLLENGPRHRAGVGLPQSLPLSLVTDTPRGASRPRLTEANQALVEELRQILEASTGSAALNLALAANRELLVQWARRMAGKEQA